MNTPLAMRTSSHGRTGFRGQRFRRPQLLALNFTSTLSPTLVNEVRSGMRRTGGNSFNGLNDPDNGAAAQAFFPNFSGYPTFIGLGTGQVNFQTNQLLGSTAAYNDVTSQWSWADTLSWTKAHTRSSSAAKLRRGHSLGQDAGMATTSIPRAIGGEHRALRYRPRRSAAQHARTGRNCHDRKQPEDAQPVEFPCRDR